MNRVADRRVDQQRFLEPDPRPILTSGEARPHIGEAIESIAAAALGAERLQTVAGRWCPDVWWQGAYGEVKGMGPGTGALFLHESQVEAAQDRSRPYRLLVVLHRYRIALPTTDAEIAQAMRDSVYRIVVLSSKDVRRLLKDKRWRTINGGRRGKHINRRQIEALDRPVANRHLLPWGDRLVEIRCTPDCAQGHYWPPAYRDLADQMLGEMDASAHVVRLTPLPPRFGGRKRRTVVQRNPAWMYEIQAAKRRRPHPNLSERKARTMLYRIDIRRWLQAIVDDRPITEVAAERLLPVMRDIMVADEVIDEFIPAERGDADDSFLTF